MPCESCVTYRATQNPDTPNLPFAQVQYNPMWSGTINPDRPDLPFAQTSYASNRARNVYVVYWKNGSQTEMVLTQSMVDHYTNLGHRVELKSSGGNDPIKPASSPHWTPAEIKAMIKEMHGGNIQSLYRIHEEQEGRITDAWEHRKSIEAKVEAIDALDRQQVLDIIKSEYQDDIDKLFIIHEEQEGRITDAWEHRKSIEAKVEDNISKFPDIHTKLKTLGRSVSDVSSGLEAHKIGHNGGGCDCAFYDIPCQMKCGVERLIPYILIGGLAIYTITRKKR